MSIKNRSGLEIIAGPCSINRQNIQEIYQLADLTIVNLHGERQRALWGTRVVGLKSRSEHNIDPKKVGIDQAVIEKNIIIHLGGGSIHDFHTPPSVSMMAEIMRDTGLNAATEIQMPEIQLPVYRREIPDKKLLIWNPSVEQLGWPLLPYGVVAAEKKWSVGIKNGKWLGIDYDTALDENSQTVSDLERTWVGLKTFAISRGLSSDQIVLIHRGVMIPERGNYRNALIHEIAARAKKSTGAKLYFDPSHSCGPNLRNQIVEETIKAMLMRVGNNWLYNGILIEVGTSTTDTNQHISINELEALVKELAKKREIKPASLANRDIRINGLVTHDASYDYK